MPRETNTSTSPVLTPRQMQVLRFVRDYRDRHGYSPTMQELADHFGVSKVTVFEHVVALERKGLLRRLPHKARSLVLTARAWFPEERTTVLPWVGTIAAGAPIEALPQAEAIDLGSLFARRNEVFVLRVRGDSMVDEHIRDGDYVIVEKRTEPRNGETVVALVDGCEATLKKFYRERGRIRLVPANEAYEPIVVEPERVQIQGVVVGVLRQY